MPARQERARLATTVRGSPAGLHEAAQAFERFSAEHGVSDATRRAVQVVLDELLSNTIRCAEDGRRVSIDLVFSLGDADVEVVITDDAAPFNPLEAAPADTTSPLSDRAIGGLGLMLVRELVDRMEYEYAGGRNRVMLEKRLDA